MAGLCEGGNEPPGSLKASNFAGPSVRYRFLGHPVAAARQIALIDDVTSCALMSYRIPAIISNKETVRGGIRFCPRLGLMGSWRHCARTRTAQGR
ncbi:hypothetical protein ANN_03827 [Periplaneta americana]|uniref:Uncharacterized protein n=1 Tax=Periplaneta americana TaxID=6978 RepID=A0ABQ8U015_PERAM|nr:hypothetical protein ANN_03827 [Periplaneta americana]